MGKEATTLVQLSPEQIAGMKKTQGDLEKAKHEVAALKKMGMNTADLDDKIAWAENVIKTMLETWAK